MSRAKAPADIGLLPPQDLAAEAGVLGGVFADPSVLDAVHVLLREEDFYKPSHRHTYAAMRSLAARGETADPVSVLHELERLGLLEQAGGRDGLAELLTAATTGIYAEHHAGIVRGKALARQLGYAAAAIGEATRSGLHEPDELVALAEAQIRRVADEHAPSGSCTDPLDLATRACRGLCEPQVLGRDGVLSFGLPLLDRLGVYIARGDYPVLAAPTAGGKTVLAMQIAYSVAERYGEPVIYVSLEMAPEVVVQRAIVARSGVPVPFGRGLQGADREATEQAAAEIGRMPVLFPDPVPRQLDQFLPWLATQCRRTRPLLVVVDHIGLLRTNARDLYHRTTEVSQRLREFTLRGDRVPLLALAQLRRAESRRDGKSRPPELHDLKDSGSIENDATAVLMIDRPWLRASTEDRRSANIPESQARLYVKKHRNGATHRAVDLVFDGALFRFREPQEPHHAR